ncbi:rod shape-determining protein MreC [Candidatus Clostridium radicumherbarum]|uniref:Cell shape-determining protein MreC n=1 Tax=Candidatus Clostridium radicumherbarum TaxID=3381662 RepID=A0ABW8TR02_9CLOT
MSFFRNKLAVTIVVLSVTFLILISYSVKRDKVSVVENGVGTVFNKMQYGVSKTGSVIKDSLTFVFNFTKVKQENEALKQENDKLQNQLVEYNSAIKENQTLKEDLNFKNQRSEYNYIGCNVIGNSGGNYLDGFIIDKGQKDNIKKGMVVITAAGLVGQVTSTASNWSIIQSISNENIAVSGMVESANEINGIVKGYKDDNNNLLAKLYYLPLDSAIKKGDVILTSGFGNLYPKGIRIGEVTDIEVDQGKIMENAIIKPYVDFNKLQQVLVVVPKDVRDIKY